MSLIYNWVDLCILSRYNASKRALSGRCLMMIRFEGMAFMENSQPFHDPVENGLDVEIMDLPENSGQGGSMSWIARRVLAGQRAVARHGARWRMASMLISGVLVLVVLGFVLNNLAMLLMPHPHPTS